MLRGGNLKKERFKKKKKESALLPRKKKKENTLSIKKNVKIKKEERKHLTKKVRNQDLTLFSFINSHLGKDRGGGGGEGDGGG